MPGQYTQPSPPYQPLRELHRLLLADYACNTELYDDYLQTGCRVFSLASGLLVRVQDQTASVLAGHNIAPLETGSEFLTLATPFYNLAAETSSCEETNAEGLCLSLSPGATPIHTYLMATIRVEGRVYGAICFADTGQQEKPFTADDIEFIELLARALGRHLERQQLEGRRKQAMQMVRENMELFESAFEHAAIGMALVSPLGKWLRVNHALCDLLGYSPAQLLEMDFHRISHPSDSDNDLDLRRQTLAGERHTYRVEKRLIHCNGDYLWVLLNVSMVRESNGMPRYFLFQIQDISAQKQALQALSQRRRELEAANEKLRDIAMTDPLTETRNRRSFDIELEKSLKLAEDTGVPLSLLMVDVDHFKAYNDNHGHPAGDAALRAVSEALRRAARTDDVVARYGGEEFAVILPGSNDQSSTQVAERLRLNIESLVDLPAPITVSIGAATFDSRQPQKPESRLLLKQADRALYRAKEQGRNQVWHAVDIPQSYPPDLASQSYPPDLACSPDLDTSANRQTHAGVSATSRPRSS